MSISIVISDIIGKHSGTLWSNLRHFVFRQNLVFGHFKSFGGFLPCFGEIFALPTVDERLSSNALLSSPLDKPVLRILNGFYPPKGELNEGSLWFECLSFTLGY